MEITELLTLGIKEGVSDIHISAEQSPIFRIDGDLCPALNYPVLDAGTAQRIIYSIMTAEQVKKFESELELDFAISLPGVSRFRVNVFQQANGVSAVFRVIPDNIPTLDQLNFPDVFKQLLNLSNGLILVTGPTGSGKSTTLAAMVDYLNTTQAYHIITIEDPIEFTHRSKKSLITQRQVGRDTRSFNLALRSALREDPDVILLGEMRDLETVRLALTAAETGHLVMATLHTSTAPRAVSRIVDVFPAGEKNIIRNMLSESLQAVICQTLIRRKDKGRVSAFEIMLGTSAIRNLIREDKVAQMYTSIQTGSEVGMCTLEQYLHILVAKQLITATVAQEAIINKEIFSKNRLQV
ncbi:MAG: twitching motility protein PilT [Gammaproteobacteria bacterium RIFCSPHIGHO2_12_FULL_41_20]|nr:MAG: twitching motility protein PilT [Gammaproteobacteria bacterium RIFCSPHIGHO2_12_FULL_41_20]